MSATSWKKEFYPQAASRVPKAKALAHSLKKWEGLTRANLKRHAIDVPPIYINSNTCALCYHACYSRSGDSCNSCPIVITTGNQCFDAYDAYDCSLRSTPAPMIRLLKRVIKAQR